MTKRLISSLLVGTALFVGCATRPPPTTVEEWIVADAVPLERVCAGDRGHTAFSPIFDASRIVALGEATHGQSESFAWKRALTLHLVRHHGYRMIAYEASATTAVACDDYISGRSDDLGAAIGGLGMLIWQVEENASLLRELRAWNASAAERDLVRFVGFDVQDTTASATRLSTLLRGTQPTLAARVDALVPRIGPALQTLWGGDRQAYEELQTDAAVIMDEIASLPERDLPTHREAGLRARELRLGLQMFASPGGRDRAMAAMLLAILDDAPPETRTVVWAHNGHVTRAPLRYLGVDELAMGGELTARFGDDYYAVGFAFGQGEFVALDRDAAGAWGFRPYRIDPAPEGSLEHPFAKAVGEPIMIDMRAAPRDGPVAAWLDAGHGQRWLGGYNVPADVRSISTDVTRLLPTTPRADYDALLYLPTTTASTPIKRERLLPPLE